MKNLIINEVDCYISNAYRIWQITKEKAVQHQIILVDEKGNWNSIKGTINRPADSDRGERKIFEVEINNKAAELWVKAIKLSSTTKNEICQTIKEYNIAAEFNKPIKKQMKAVLAEMYNLIDLPFSKEQFIEFSL